MKRIISIAFFLLGAYFAGFTKQKSNFEACLWPSPSWVYNNDIGKGFNTNILKTIEIRELVDLLGIKTNYVSCNGLYKIEELK